MLLVDVIDIVSGRNVSSSNNYSCFVKQDDDNIKASEPVADKKGKLI
jgi:hypothetical protein